MTEVKRIDIQELSDEGYIGEANRRFFHPLGLALERSSGWTREDVEQTVNELGATTQDEHEVVWEFVQRIGLDRPHLTGVWDERDDPEGVVYGGDYLPLMAAAHAHIDELWKAREPARVAALGYMVQPTEESP